MIVKILVRIAALAMSLLVAFLGFKIASQSMCPINWCTLGPSLVLLLGSAIGITWSIIGFGGHEQ